MKLISSSGGFSLIEVLCAILILGVGMVGLTQGLTAALQSSKESELQTAAALIAAGRIEALRAEGYLAQGVERGQGDAGLSLYQWEQSVGHTDVDGLYQVTVIVQHAKTGKPIFELQTLLFEPPYSPSATEPNSGRGARADRRRDRRER